MSTSRIGRTTGTPASAQTGTDAKVAEPGAQEATEQQAAVQQASRVRTVTITIPIVDEFPRRSDGQPNDGELGHVDGRLGRGAAQGLQRVLLAMQELSDQGLEVACFHSLPPFRRQVMRIEVVRMVFAAIEKAITEQR